MKLEQKYLSLLREAERREIPNLDNIRLCFQTLSLSNRIDRDCASLLAPHGLSEGRFVLLFLLDAEREGLAPNQLADKAGVSRATVTGLLDGLERELLVERQSDSHDRRALRIGLTAKGKKLAKKVVDQHSRWIASLFGNLSNAECKHLSVLLNKVASQLPAGDD